MNVEGHREDVVGSEEEMIALGRRVGEGLRAGDVLGLSGDLGSGKTHFVKGLAEGLGAREAVTSPTFTLVHEYREGRVPMHHFDFYRMENAEEVLAIGWDEYLGEGESVVVVEWAEKFPGLFSEETQWWFFEIGGEGEREVRRGVRP